MYDFKCKDVNGVEEASQVMRELELASNSRFVVHSSPKGFGNGDIRRATTVYWKDHQRVQIGRQEFDGVPFVVLGLKSFDCQFGKDRKEKWKADRDKQSNLNNQEHQYAKGKKFLLQPTKKIECPARCIWREIVKFPSLKIDVDTPEKLRDTKARDIWNDIQKGNQLESQRIIRVCFPHISKHDRHPVDEVAPQTIDKMVSCQIKELILKGIRDIVTIKRLLRYHVNKECHPLPHPTNRRFYPTDKMIGNCIFTAMNIRKEEDMHNLIKEVQNWHDNNKKDSIYCRLKSDEEKEENMPEQGVIQSGQRFLFMYQSADQRRLMRRYGSMIFLDATYKCTLYDLPLFFMAVRTNVDYQIICTFIVEDETVKSIVEALELVKSLNSDFQFRNFMTDFDESEIGALQQVFPGTKVFICDFHRCQAWERWCKRKDTCGGKPEETLSALRQLASAQTEAEFQQLLSTLQSSPLWSENKTFQNYLNKVWLPHKRRWAKAWRVGDPSIVANTNNGLESQHKVFKTTYLENKTTFKLCQMVHILIHEFFPDRYNKYVEMNRLVSGKFRPYMQDLPDELHRRPRHFLRGCLDSLEASTEISDVDVVENQTGIYTVRSAGCFRTVNLGDIDAWPSCDCHTWLHENLPCQHMVAAIRCNGKVQWERLSPLYLKSVYSTVDDVSITFETEDKPISSPESPEKHDVNSTQTFEAEDKPISSPVSPEKHDVNSTQTFEAEDKPISSPVSPEKHEKDVLSINMLQKACREAAKQIGSATYELNDGHVLKTMIDKLSDIMLYINKTKGAPAGLFHVRLPRKRKRLQKYRRRSGIKASWLRKQRKPSIQPKILCTDSVPGPSKDVLQMDDTVIEDPLLVAEKPHMYAEEDDFTRQYQQGDNADISRKATSVPEDDKVMKLWALPQDFDVPVAKVYGTCVTDTDIRSLQGTSWLTDNVIDTYLKVLTVELDEAGFGKSLHLWSSTVGHIISGNYSFRTSFQLSDYRFAVGAYIRAQHWTLIVLDMDKKIIYYYNPKADAEALEISSIKVSMCGFLARCLHQNEADVRRSWRSGSIAHSSQHDSFNCGVYCLMFAEQHLKGKFEEMTLINQKMLSHMRQRIARKMLLFEDFMTDCCPKCGVVVEENDQKLHCASCGRAHHFKPFCIEADIAALSDGDQFCCTLCRFHVWDLPSEYKCTTNSYQWIDRDKALIDLCDRGHSNDDEVQIIETQPDNARKRNELARNKQKRKSSIFEYAKPRKMSRKKYCVCRQQNNGRLYWNCEGCEEWYHPACMGKEEEDEPALYLCPDCQVKNKGNNDPSPPSMSEVEEELLQTIREEQVDPFDDSNCGDLQGHQSTPLYLNNTAVQLFFDVQKDNGRTYKIKSSSWGTFVLLSEMDMDLFFLFRNKVHTQNLLIKSKALCYFLHNYGKTIEVMHVSENVICLHPGTAVDIFKEWLNNLKVKVNANVHS